MSSSAKRSFFKHSSLLTPLMISDGQEMSVRGIINAEKVLKQSALNVEITQGFLQRPEVAQLRTSLIRCCAIPSFCVHVATRSLQGTCSLFHTRNPGTDENFSEK